MGEIERGAPEQPGQSAADEPGSQLSLWPVARDRETASAAAGTEAAIPAEPVWTLTDLGSFVLFVAFVSLPAALVGTAVVFFGLRQAFGWEITMAEAFTRVPVMVAMQTSWEALWLGFLYFTITVKYGQRFWDAVRWTRGANRPRNWLTAGALLALAAQLFFYISPTGNDLPIERLFTSPAAGYVLAAFGIVVAPFIEELVFRGFFYPVFERMWGFWTAVLLTALLFAVIHVSQLWGGWEEIAAIFVVGTAFSYARGKTGSLVPSYLMHLGYNAALFVSLYFSTNGFRELKG